MEAGEERGMVLDRGKRKRKEREREREREREVVVEKGDRAERTGEMIGLNREQRDKVYFPTRTYGR